MPSEAPYVASLPGAMHVDQPSELSALFHRLNNHLGIILANAELLEAKSANETTRSRAEQIVASVLEAMRAAKDIRSRTEGSSNR